MINNILLETILQSKKVVGTKQVLKSIESNTVKCVIVADNADGFIRNQIIVLCHEKGIKVEKVPSKEALGKLCGIDVSAACVGLI